MTTTENRRKTHMTMAQQALDIYDQRGEFAMLPFIMAHVRPKQDPDEEHCEWTEQGYLLLDDGSDVTHRRGSYLFGWREHASGKQTHAERSSQMPDQGRPDPTGVDPIPAIRCPGLYDAWASAMDIVQNQAGREDEPPIIDEPDDSYRMAPSLNDTIRRAIRATNAEAYIEKHADRICQEIAAAALKLLPPDELQALSKHVKQAA